jgi:hypothetical protein
MRLISILSFVLCLTAFSSYSQIVALEVKNPFPRVGDECEVEYTIKTDTFKVSETISFKEQMKAIRDKELGSGTMKFTKLINDTGYTSFGPFIFTVDKKKIQSDIISLHFDNPLPKEKSGVWIRQNSYLGQEYLIIEQRISGEWVTTKTTDNSISSEFQKDNDEFIEIDKEKIDAKYIEFDFSYSTSKSQDVEINGKSETVSYKISLYKITKTELFKTKFKLDKTNLKSLPIKHNTFEFYVK